MGPFLPEGRQAKNKARLQRYEELAAEAERFRKIDTAEINIPPGPRLGSVVLEVNGLSKGFGDRVLIKDLSFSLPRAGSFQANFRRADGLSYGFEFLDISSRHGKYRLQLVYSI